MGVVGWGCDKDPGHVPGALGVRVDLPGHVVCHLVLCGHGESGGEAGHGARVSVLCVVEGGDLQVLWVSGKIRRVGGEKNYLLISVFVVVLFLQQKSH